MRGAGRCAGVRKAHIFICCSYPAALAKESLSSSLSSRGALNQNARATYTTGLPVKAAVAAATKTTTISVRLNRRRNFLLIECHIPSSAPEGWAWGRLTRSCGDRGGPFPRASDSFFLVCGVQRIPRQPPFCNSPPPCIIVQWLIVMLVVQTKAIETESLGREGICSVPFLKCVTSALPKRGPPAVGDSSGLG